MKLYGEVLPELTPEQLTAVQAFAREHGRYWKQDLRDAWMRASEIGPVHALRNSHGPRWLTGYRLPADHVQGLYVGDRARFYTAHEARSVTGVVTLVRAAHKMDPGSYAEVHVDVDGMQYIFGTGGHLGRTWTTESGSEEWFMEAR